MDFRHSYSSLQLFHQCPRAWWYTYVEKYEALGIEDALAPLRGTAFHGLAQADLMAKGAREGTLLVRNPTIEPVPGLVIAIDWTDQSAPTIPDVDLGPEVPLSPASILAHIGFWERRQDDLLREMMKGAYGDSLFNRLGDLWMRYTNHYAEENEHYRPLLTEFEWSRAAPNGRVLSGRLDSVGWNSHLGLVEVRDIKTHESWPMQTDEVIELFDAQLHLQAWGVASFLREHQEEVQSWAGDIDVTPRATVYDRVRFKQPSQPQLTKAGKLDRRFTDFTPEAYMAFVNAPESVAAGVEFDQAVYDGVSAPGKWFRRKSAPVNMNTITAQVLGLQYLADQAEAITAETALILPTKMCDWCAFSRLCESELRGGRQAIDKNELHTYGLSVKEAQ